LAAIIVTQLSLCLLAQARYIGIVVVVTNVWTTGVRSENNFQVTNTRDFYLQFCAIPCSLRVILRGVFFSSPTEGRTCTITGCRWQEYAKNLLNIEQLFDRCLKPCWWWYDASA